jgi:hypothetical protein
MHAVHLVELASLFVLAFFVVLEVRRGTLRQSASLGLLLILAAWVGEDTCIRLYRFYEYNENWHLILDKMPPMVALIWPFVILSDRRVVESILPSGSRHLPWLTGLLVVWDAALMEPVAVKAGLWQWFEPGFFNVPIIGVLGWGLFTVAALWLHDRLPPSRRALLIVLAPAITHLLLLASWWGALRWVLRGPIPSELMPLLNFTISLILCALVWRYRIRIDLQVMAPRVFAASIFFGLLFAYGRDDQWLVGYVISFAPPYLLATRWTGFRQNSVNKISLQQT